MTSAITSTAVSTLTSSTGSSTSSIAASSANSNYETFLTLLCTQLQNQSPLDPMDTNEFTSQLVSYSSLEQQMQMNDQLTALNTQLSASTALTALGYIGHSVAVEGDTAPLQDGAAAWTYDLDSSASKVTLTITDADGNTVWTGSGESSAGSHSLAWDGTDQNGDAVAAGNYTLTVTATDSSGDAVTNSVSYQAKVTGVDSSSGTTKLTLGTQSVALGDITNVTA